jgi:hypothetical protein
MLGSNRNARRRGVLAALVSVAALAPARRWRRPPARKTNFDYFNQDIGPIPQADKPDF